MDSNSRYIEIIFIIFSYPQKAFSKRVAVFFGVVCNNNAWVYTYKLKFNPWHRFTNLHKSNNTNPIHEQKCILLHSISLETAISQTNVSASDTNLLNWPSGKWPFDCPKIAKNLTFFSKKLTKIFIFQQNCQIPKIMLY